ncbi:hypothetical protein HHK36_017067 [Tetracentron sinense]|uniref:Peptidase C14 caspase domain-containing protein n=1 Tax=Tetracentron sinense TaxID=13715 RepID=A0A834Z3W3_TETSI|nr:hypothetical protein HHK36_017067 [Tetracentron sinense]
MYMEKGKKRMAILVGCNYPNTQNELHGCINDVLTMRDVLVSRFGFDPSYMELLTDAPGSLVMPTGANIKSALNGMVDRAEPGDVLFFHYSGHGTRIPSTKPSHPFRQDEAIVPCDFNLITDMDFRQLVNRLPGGASFTILSDSCHSGGLIDKEKEQIGPSSVTTNSKSLSYSPKTIPFDSVMHHLTSLTGIDSSDIGTHLSEVFGSDASIKFCAHELEQDLLGSLRPDAGILLSGCQANETSADMNPTSDGGKAYGAFSNAVHMVLKKNVTPLSNREVVTLAREVLQAQGFDQHPCLYCCDNNAGAPFLWQPDRSSL